MKKRNLIGFVLVAILFGCQNNADTEENGSFLNSVKEGKTEIEHVFRSEVVVILSKPLEEDSKTIHIQDYESEKGNFVPVFTTMEKYKQSSKGAKLGKQIIQINGMLLLSLLNGTELIRINPELNDEKYLKAADLKNWFGEEMKNMRFQIDSLIIKD